MCDIREFIQALGGCRAVAQRLGAKYTTIHSHLAAGAFPAKYYDAFCALAVEVGREPPPKKLFSFVQIPEAARRSGIAGGSGDAVTDVDSDEKRGAA
ncbi:hypothetical protein BV509_20460 [Rhodovulum sulfidophilum]|uniref:YdaS antitoxin of YdaST toxin-antitoxin system n=2 Tax=Rhodovulum TaxID=34008 RepID=A0ABS1RMD5_9RHOB|nr:MULTISPECIES: hypothetical protein [Rhodovulum]MBL3571349.1 hypothetical protein [Rhodovulum visakhapatnamense]MBL3580669.1 hypothetical protein [Rhodovulum visakhapatnamense]OLS46489.1 hypothetical protein BV509_20460 [Rhodovulum sulfidophilum]RAP39764.1 hypothetical protein BYZ73_18925 [Rhodovulum viride]